MKVCIVPNSFDLDLGYRTVRIEAGERGYPDEIADHQQMAQYLKVDPPPPAPPAPAKSSASVQKDA